MAAVNSWVNAWTILSLLVYALGSTLGSVLDWDEQDGL